MQDLLLRIAQLHNPPFSSSSSPSIAPILQHLPIWRATAQTHWPQAAAALLLQLVRCDPGFKTRKYFQESLAECQYQELKVDTGAGTMAATMAMTPLFSTASQQVSDGGLGRRLSGDSPFILLVLAVGLSDGGCLQRQ